MNPYDFVRLAGQAPERGPVQMHHAFKGESGRIECRLTARTPLFVPQYRAGTADRTRVHERLKMYRDPRRGPLIPGTSLKGVIRNVAEAAANACFTLPNRLSYERQTLEYELPPDSDFRTCGDLKLLCPACRLFGMLNGSTVFAGNVTVQDAVAEPGFKTAELTLGILSAPKPRHKPFYSTAPEKRKPPIRGRKFYYHRPQGVLTRQQRDGQNKTVEAVTSGVFTFEVEYTNVSEPDLNLLLFALSLWDDTCHKVGMGKPIGLGSARIEIVRLSRMVYQDRYTRFGSGWQAPLEGAALSDFVSRHTAAYRDGSGVNLLDLHRILRWDEHAPETNYPGQDWFRTHHDEPLEKAP